MKKIILSVSIIGVVAAIAFGITTAFFSDTETSTGNTFTAGELDLKISNTSYIKDHVTGLMVASPNTSWAATDLTGEKFFNFSDVKPGDVGEDTIDLTIINNPAWACAKITLTSNNDNGLTEPEGKVDTTDGVDNGELAQGIEFVWWADDGDNVLEVGEEATKYYLGPDSIMNLLGADKVLDLTLADSVLNFFKLQYPNGGPLAGNVTHFIGKGWCYGDMTLVPVAEGSGSPIARGTGFNCNGDVPGNEGQSDSLTADIEFTVIQARNNMQYLCPEHVKPTTTVQSSVFNFSGTGWAGWSCPSNYPNIISADTTNCAQPLAVSQAAETEVGTYPNYPHYNYTPPEEGWVIQNGGTSQSCYIVLTCQAN